jgi:hypothetical protein
MKRGAEDASVSLDRLVKEHRDELVRDAESTPAILRARLERLRRRQAGCTARADARLRHDLERCAQKLEAEVRALENMEHVRAFDRAVVPYLRAYHSCVAAGKKRTTGQRSVCAPNACTAAATAHAAEVVDEYLAEVKGEIPRARLERADLCPRCPDQVMFLVPTRAILACPRCGLSATFLDAVSSSIGYDESVDMVSFSYKRGNHFHDHLVRVQGLETYEVPRAVIESVMLELYRQRVVRLEDVTTRRVRDVLKSMRLRRCYDHCAQIVSRITGRPSLRLPPEASELCRLMFTAIQAPFQHHCPPERKNMLSYSFVLHKLLYILGYDELCDTLLMLKSREKVQYMELIWQKIAESLDWEYFATPL